jgi:hypothetical protein
VYGGRIRMVASFVRRPEVLSPSPSPSAGLSAQRGSREEQISNTRLTFDRTLESQRKDEKTMDSVRYLTVIQAAWLDA